MIRRLEILKAVPEPLECNKIETMVKDEPDDVFICCGSPEERCKGTARKLAPNYKAKEVLLLRYTNHESRKREDNIKEMKDRLKTVGKIVEFVIDEDKPIPVIRDIVQEIMDHIGTPEKSRVTIDFSTIIKWHLLILLKALDLNGIRGNARFLYTEPEDYMTDLFQPLSFGIRNIFPIPTYSGNFDFSKGSLLVLILGYEGDRALSLLEEMDPTKCLLLVAKPAYHPEWEGRTEEMNEEIINTVGKARIRYVDSRNPVLVSEQLKELLSNRTNAEYNHIISPLGTKPQTLGLYLYLSTDPPSTVVIYGSPSRHNELFYSKGIGRSWVIPFSRD
jgi:hypothetical protein